MKIKKFELTDIQDDIEWTIPITPDIVNRISQLSTITILTNEDEMVCIIGGEVIAPGVAIVVMLCSTRIQNHKLATIKEIKQALEFYVSYYQLRKLYTTAIVQTQRWVELMGFKWEYTMKDVYGEGLDLYGYSMLINRGE